MERDGVRLHYEVEGRGPAIAFPPPPFAGAEFFRHTGHLDSLRERHTVIRVDPRGHGLSDRPETPAAHGIEEYRDDLATVLDAAGVDRTVVAGPYDGAFVGLALALERPDRVSGVIDFDATEAADLCDDPERQGRLELARNLRTRGAEVLREHVRSYGVPDDTPVARDIITSDPQMVALELQEWTSWKGPFSLLSRLRVPILFLRDDDVGEAAVPSLRKAAGPSARIQVIRGVGHWSLVTEAAHTLSLVRDFTGRVQA